jgi:hypothetical protein
MGVVLAQQSSADRYVTTHSQSGLDLMLVVSGTLKPEHWSGDLIVVRLAVKGRQPSYRHQAGDAGNVAR